MPLRPLPALACAAALLACAVPARAAPGIHAHRGGSLLEGVPTFPENTLPAFANAARSGWVLELDVKLTADGVPVVIHDATLDRTTTCSGQVRAISRAALAGCRADVLGSPGNGLATRPAATPAPIPTLAEALELARREGAFLNLEIKNVPTDPDFDSSSGFANRVMDAVVASGVPRERLIVQSFWPPNLDVARQRLPGVETSLLTQSQTNEGGPAFAAGNGYSWVSPAWPVSQAYVAEAHGLGRRVVPYTLNREEDVKAAGAAGVDALISDDPAMAQLALGLGRPRLAPDPFDPVVRLDAPTYASDRSRGRGVRVRWRATDRGSGIARYRLEVRRQSNASTRWRPVVRSTTGRRAIFRGQTGDAYVFRLRARDRFGNLSKYAYDATVVPLDDRSRRLRFSRGWRRLRQRGPYGSTVRRARRVGRQARLRFRGVRVALIAGVSARGARLLVSVDRDTRVVSLRAGRRRHRVVVFRSARLRPGLHTLRVRTISRGVADLDAVGVDTGPPPPRR